MGKLERMDEGESNGIWKKEWPQAIFIGILKKISKKTQKTKQSKIREKMVKKWKR